MSKLFTPLTIGKTELKHRIVLAPLTRLRADDDLCPTERHVEYYSQRATDGGLLISEATLIAPQSINHNHVPGIWTDKQTAAWKNVSDAIKAKGGLLSIQIWHQGRVAHHSYKDHPLAKEVGAITCESSSAVPLSSADLAVDDTIQPHLPPKEMTLDDIARLKKDYVRAAKNAVSIGAIIELHAAHGYLLDQFHNDGVNKRTDQYGGSIENRIRLTLEVLRELVAAVGAENVAIRLSPHQGHNCFFECTDSNPDELYTTLIKAIDAEFSLAYLLITEPRWDRSYTGDVNKDPNFDVPCINYNKYRHLITKTPVIAAGGFTPASAVTALEQENPYDGIGFGRWFISNPDIVLRIREKLPLTGYVRATFYIGAGWHAADKDDGYTDYPMFEEYCKAAGYTLEQVLADRSLIDKVIEVSKTAKYPLIPQEEIGSSTSSAQRASA